ncbi:MAG: Type pantothenate kinase [Dehalococcoidia bacterium]|nr:Type pantothenate kinase [Dehalococcoidia bacterium]
MLLALDIGNTNIVAGVFQGEELRATWRMATSVHRTADEYAIVLLGLLQNKGVSVGEIKEVVICSVVPPLTETFEKLSREYCGVAPLVVEVGVKTGVRIQMENPREVGADRIVNAAAAHRLYGGPLIVIDLGTATTFDAVSKEGDYLGGAIAPGIGIAAEALFQRTAMLPRVEMVRPPRAIGKNTVAAMQSGIIFGYSGLIEGVVSRIKREMGGQVKVVATGGLAGIMAKDSPVIDIVNPDLTLYGLRLVHDINKS